MESELIPTEDEFEVLIQALTVYSYQTAQRIANEEVIKATQRMDSKTGLSENEKAFAVFAPKGDDSGADSFLNGLAKEIDQESILQKCKNEADKLTLLGAKVIRLRNECRKLGTHRAIDELLK